MLNKSDLFFDALLRQNIIEDAMKSVAWTSLNGAIFAMSIVSLYKHNFFAAFVFALIFTIALCLSMVYVVTKVVIPLDNSMFKNDVYWDEQKESLKGLARVFASLRLLFLRKNGFYMMLTMGYFLYTFIVGDFIVSRIAL